MYYKAARFTKAIGLSKVSGYFTGKMTTEKVKKIHAIETALSHSIKIGIISKHKKPTLQTKRLEKLGTDIQGKLEARRGR